MGGDLDRGLGLVALVTISVGAMIGPGLFVLPGLAAEMAGPAVVAAYVIAGLVALPAALSKAELATAMPDSGGPYLYIDRSMGPLAGTVAGLGAWLSLLFKAAFALVGGVAYLAVVSQLGAGALELSAIVAGLLLVGANLVGAEETGSLQTLIVVGVLAVLAVFAAVGIPSADGASLTPFAPHGSTGVLAAAGFVFVSFIGIMKIASIAEEAEDPDRNLPRALLGSLAIVLVVYPVLVFLLVSLVPMGTLTESLTPMAEAAGRAGGTALLVAVSVAAIAALASMANAAILAASRIPFALSRDDLAPAILSRVSDRLGTPAAAILASGGLMLGLVATMPVHDLAELASAFLILVFGAMNAAVLVLREGEADWYEPAFESPGYPWVQIAGIGGGLVLLTQMGALPMLGAVGLVTGGLAWYFAYARRRTAREGVAVDVLRRWLDRKSLAQAEQWVDEEGHTVVLAGQTREPARADAMTGIGGSIAGGRAGRLVVAERPGQTVLDDGVTGDELSALLATTPEGFRTPIEARSLGEGSLVEALSETARAVDADVLMVDAAREAGLPDLEPLAEQAPCDIVRCWPGSSPGPVEAVHVVSQRGGFDPMKVRIASEIAGSTGASVSLLHVVPSTATGAQLASIRDYHHALGDLCGVPAKSKVLRADDPVDAVHRAARRADVLVVGDDAGEDLEELVARTAGPNRTVLSVHPVADRRRSTLDRVRERMLYRL